LAKTGTLHLPHCCAQDTAKKTQDTL
jgi:hypothetical protein